MSRVDDVAGGRWQRVVLVGFMGAGKSTLGPLLGERLGWEFLDVDAELVRRSGVSVAGWFAGPGEAAFREEESRLTGELCCRDRLVLAPGGGWIMGGGSLAGLPAGTAVVWLRVSPQEAVRRLDSGGEVRPLLAGTSPLERAAALLREREPFYALADFQVDTNGRTPAELVNEIVAWLKTSSS